MRGHALVGEDHGDLLAAQRDLPQGLQGRVAGVGSDDAVEFAVLATEVACDGPGDSGVVVHREDDGSGHGPSVGGPATGEVSLAWRAG